MAVKKALKIVWTAIKMAIIGLIFASLTVFVFANSIEVLFNKDIPHIHALDKLSSKTTLDSIVGGPNEGVRDIDAGKVGNFGKPKMLKIPSMSSKLNLIESIVVGDDWLYRANNGHYIIVSDGKNGNIGDVVIYANASWRTFPTPEHLKIGDNLFLDTDTGWRYMFRITNRSVVHPDDPYVKGDSAANSLILIMEDKDTGLTYVLQGMYISIQNTQK
ncbi:MAG: hypothetical protein PHT88_01785 [Candidatus Moranbacteria bacterium]|nr:hypothetical protein [Candidatus Moranbacteria bacterium]